MCIRDSSRRQFWDLIKRIRVQRPQMSVMVSTAYMDEADGFDWLVAMDDGKVLAEGTPTELKNRVGADNLDAAFIKLLPEEKRRGHVALVVPPRQVVLEGTPAIEAEGLTRRFGDFIAVNHVSFKIPKGEIFGFLGSNGCGKTTTMKMLTGLLPSTEGTAMMFGEKVTGNDLATRKRIGFMSQAFSLYAELTVRQNLVLHARVFDLPKDQITPRIQELIKQFGLENYMEDLAESLPLGTRQRLSLAVAMIHKPELLILDEPTSGAVSYTHLQVIVRLDKKDLLAQVRAAEAEVAQQKQGKISAKALVGQRKSELLLAKQNLARSKSLYVSKDIDVYKRQTSTRQCTSGPSTRSTNN